MLQVDDLVRHNHSKLEGVVYKIRDNHVFFADSSGMDWHTLVKDVSLFGKVTKWKNR